jgi:hypothetical protein
MMLEGIVKPPERLALMLRVGLLLQCTVGVYVGVVHCTEAPPGICAHKLDLKENFISWFLISRLRLSLIEKPHSGIEFCSIHFGSDFVLQDRGTPPWSGTNVAFVHHQTGVNSMLVSEVA